MEDQDLQLREGLEKALNLSTIKLCPPFFLHASPHPSSDCRPQIGKKNSFNTNFIKNFASGAHFQFHNHDLFPLLSSRLLLHHVWTALPFPQCPQTIWGKPCRCGENPTQQQKILICKTRKSPLTK